MLVEIIGPVELTTYTGKGPCIFLIMREMRGEKVRDLRI